MFEREPIWRFTYSLPWERMAQQRERARLVLRLLQLHFQTRPSNLSADVIRNTNDMALLERWFELAFECATLAEFEEQMQLWRNGAMTEELKRIAEREEPLAPPNMRMPWTTEEMAVRDQRRRMILLVIGLRFETIPNRGSWERIGETEDLEQLDRWLALAYTADSLDVFQERMMRG